MVEKFLEPYRYVPAGSKTVPKSPRTWDGVVIHYTAGGSATKTAKWAKGRIGKSWHFIGPRSGEFIQQVPLDEIAWHAGRSYWPHSNGETLRGANYYAIGIELANHGPLDKVGDKFFYEIEGHTFRYRGPKPVEAELVFDNGETVLDWWEPYTDSQYDDLNLLLGRLEAVGIPRRLVGHEDIALPFSKKKFDPGPLFDWSRVSGRINPRTKASFEF